MNNSFLKTVLVCVVCLFACLEMSASSDSSKVIYRGKGFSLEKAKDPYAGHVSKPVAEEPAAVQQEKTKESVKATAVEHKKEASSPKADKVKAKSKKQSAKKSKSKAKISEAQPVPSNDKTDKQSQGGFKKKFKEFTKHLPWYVKLGILVLIFFSIVRFFSAIGSACPVCRKWSAMREVDKEIIDEKASNIKVRSKNRVGDIEGFIDQRVPATIYTYKITYRCRFCGHESVEYKSEKIEN